MNSSAPKIALLLQGGGALGAYHIGAYQALSEAGKILQRGNGHGSDPEKWVPVFGKGLPPRKRGACSIS